jgi:hypothetical protein
MCVEYECDRCHRVQSVQEGPVAYYNLPDGRRFFGPHGVGWCSCCGRLTEVEEVVAAHVMEMRFEMMRALPGYTPSPGLEEHFKTQTDWARTRTQPPRCLRCGSRALLPLQRCEEQLLQPAREGFALFGHPGCGGVFRVKEVLFSQPLPRCLSVDGELLEGNWDGAFRRWAHRLWG